MFPLRAPLVGLLLATAPVAACTPLRSPPGAGAPDGKLITRAQIESSGATNAWEVLAWSGAHLLMEGDGEREPLRIRSRGQSSLVLDDSPVIVVDGARSRDVRILWNIPARVITSVRVLTGARATTYHGTGAGGGAVVIRTRMGPDR